MSGPSHPSLSFCHVPASRGIHLDPLVNTEEEGMWLVSCLFKWASVDLLSAEYYLSGDIALQSFVTICRSRYFKKTWSWTDPDLKRLDLEHLGAAVLTRHHSTAQQHRDLARLDRADFDATMTEERSRWTFLTIRGASLRWGLKKLSMGFREWAIRFLDDG